MATYSKGNRQKVALVAALASSADLFLFDEPTDGLDPLMVEVFRQEVASLRAPADGAAVEPPAVRGRRGAATASRSCGMAGP